MKRFEIHAKDDGRVVLANRPDGYGEVRDFLWRLKECNEDGLAEYYLAGKPVDWQTMLDACAAESEKYWEKKRETHVEISWLEGWCENTRRYKWIPKSKARRSV